MPPRDHRDMATTATAHVKPDSVGEEGWTKVTSRKSLKKEHADKQQSDIQVTRHKRGSKASKTRHHTFDGKAQRVAEDLTKLTLQHAIKYGNTDAYVLELYVHTDGSSSFYGGSRNFVVMTSGKYKGALHVSWSLEKQQSIESTTKRLEVDDYAAERPATCIDFRKAYRKYLRFPKLLGERIHTSKYPFKQIDFTIEFRGLPREVRDKIYRLVLKSDTAIDHYPQNGRYCIIDYKDVSEGLTTRKQMKADLGLVRVNRQYGREAAEVFYGENVFQFTNIERINDYYFRSSVLPSLVKKIGPRNVACLRNVVLGRKWEQEMPWNSWQSRQCFGLLHLYKGDKKSVAQDNSKDKPMALEEFLEHWSKVENPDWADVLYDAAKDALGALAWGLGEALVRWKDPVRIADPPRTTLVIDSHFPYEKQEQDEDEISG